MCTTTKSYLLKVFALLICGCSLVGCSSLKTATEPFAGAGIEAATWENNSSVHQHLTQLPPAMGRVVASVYSFRDQTGQYKPIPASSFSTAVTQGAGSLLIKSLRDSGWFIPVEREGLQNLLTERKIIRAATKNGGSGKPGAELPQLMGAKILLEGGIVAYDSNIKTGGAGAKYFGISAYEQYRVDQVSINLRAVDIRTGEIINSITTSKTIFSREVNSGVFRYVKFKRLLEMEAGYTYNEPAQLALLDAIETAVIRLIVTGIEQQHWALANPDDADHPILKRYGAKSNKLGPKQPV